MAKVNETVTVFQCDSEIVNTVYQSNNNYLIECTETGNSDTCALYFCSNDIYYPNDEIVFQKRIIDKNFFEWYNSRIQIASKHIFLRDVFKQWYLTGINSIINTPEKLVEYLKKETEGYKHIIAVGSSAGGYAAILYGSLIGAQKVLAFNPQFEIASLLKNSTEQINPLVFRLKDDRRDYYDIVSYINPKTEIFYFYSLFSPWDKEQHIHIKELANIYEIPFTTKHHGIPFLKVAIPTVLNIENVRLKNFNRKKQNPLLFTIKMVGLARTISGLVVQIYKAYKKRR